MILPTDSPVCCFDIVTMECLQRCRGPAATRARFAREHFQPAVALRLRPDACSDHRSNVAGALAANHRRFAFAVPIRQCAGADAVRVARSASVLRQRPGVVRSRIFSPWRARWLPGWPLFCPPLYLQPGWTRHRHFLGLPLLRAGVALVAGCVRFFRECCAPDALQNAPWPALPAVARMLQSEWRVSPV